MTPLSLSTMVLETALKMTSLSGGDLEVFVLVRPTDGSGGALWAGDDRLAEDFRRQRLSPGVADVEVTLDAAGSSSLVRREAKPDGSLVCQPFVPLGAHSIKARKRPSTSSYAKKIKVSRQSQAHDLNYDFDSTNKSTSTREHHLHDSAHATQTQFAGSSFVHHFPNSFADGNGFVGEGDEQGIQWIFDEFVPRHPKIRDVTAIHDSTVTVKNSYAFKVLNTLLYAFGREVYIKCPFKTNGHVKNEACRGYFARCFSAFFEHFPNLVALDRQKVGFHKTRLKKPYLLSLKSYCRSVVQMSFCKCFSTGGSTTQTTSTALTIAP